MIQRRSISCHPICGHEKVVLLSWLASAQSTKHRQNGSVEIAIAESGTGAGNLQCPKMKLLSCLRQTRGSTGSSSASWNSISSLWPNDPAVQDRPTQIDSKDYKFPSGLSRTGCERPVQSPRVAAPDGGTLARIETLVSRLLDCQRSHQIEHRRRQPCGPGEGGRRLHQDVDLHRPAEFVILQN